MSHEAVNEAIGSGDFRAAKQRLNEVSFGQKPATREASEELLKWFKSQMQKIGEHEEYQQRMDAVNKYESINKTQKVGAAVFLSLSFLLAIIAVVLSVLPYRFSEGACSSVYETFDNEEDCLNKCSKDENCFGFVLADLQEEEGSVKLTKVCRLFSKEGSESCQVKGKKRELSEIFTGVLAFVVVTFIGFLVSLYLSRRPGPAPEPPGRLPNYVIAPPRI